MVVINIDRGNDRSCQIVLFIDNIIKIFKSTPEKKSWFSRSSENNRLLPLGYVRLLGVELFLDPKARNPVSN